jgi:predicted CopG family antitoxin
MATKTISLELDAYEKLKAAKLPGESFSDVVRRSSVSRQSITGAGLLEHVKKRAPFFTEEDLNSIEKASQMDRPPDDPWA